MKENITRVKDDVNYYWYMNMFCEGRNLHLNEVKTKEMKIVDSPANFRNNNSITLPQSDHYYPTMTTIVNKEMTNLDITSKAGTKTRRFQYDSNLSNIDTINIRKYFDPTIYQMLLNPQERKLRNERLVIAFWDIAGFATLCNSLNNHLFVIVDLLRNFFTEAERVIRKNNGIIDKFIGDGILAFFGYRQFDESQMTLDAINTALELRETFNITKKHLAQQLVKIHFDDNQINVSLKCGIHIGNVLIGLLETKYRNQITLIGSNVNFASRLEGIAKNDEIITSEEILKLLNDKFAFESLERDIYSYGKAKVYNILSKR